MLGGKRYLLGSTRFSRSTLRVSRLRIALFAWSICIIPRNDGLTMLHKRIFVSFVVFNEAMFLNFSRKAVVLAN